MLSLASLKKLGKAWDGEARKFDFDLMDLELIGSRLACSQEELEALEGLELEGLKDLSFSQDISNPHVQINRFTGATDNFYYEDEKRFFYQYTPSYRIEPFMYFLYKGDFHKEIRAA